jgi:hypothetical protein
MAGYGLLSDIPTMDMPPTAYGDIPLSATNMSLLAVDMDMLQRRICLSQLWICFNQNFTWWIHFSRLVDMPVPT